MIEGRHEDMASGSKTITSRSHTRSTSPLRVCTPPRCFRYPTYGRINVCRIVVRLFLIAYSVAISSDCWKSCVLRHYDLTECHATYRFAADPASDFVLRLLQFWEFVGKNQIECFDVEVVLVQYFHGCRERSPPPSAPKLQRHVSDAMCSVRVVCRSKTITMVNYPSWIDHSPGIQPTLFCSGVYKAVCSICSIQG